MEKTHFNWNLQQLSHSVEADLGVVLGNHSNVVLGYTLFEDLPAFLPVFVQSKYLNRRLTDDPFSKRITLGGAAEVGVPWRRSCS